MAILPLRLGMVVGILEAIRKMPLIRLLVLVWSLSLSGCEWESVPDGRILVKNDSQDSSYNTVEVSGGGAFKALKPGEKLLLPRGTTSISFVRRYKDYTRSYQVRCPLKLKKGIVIKLIDVHVNRIAGDCETVEANKL